MKNFLNNLILILCITFTTAAIANTETYEKPDTISVAISDDGIVQINQIVTENIGVENDHQGLDIYNERSCRYDTSIATSGYSSNISINKGIVRDTNNSQVQTSYSKFTQSRQRNTSRMRVYGTESSGQNLQGNYYYPEGNYYKSQGKKHCYTEQTQLFAETILLSRIRLCTRNWS